MHVLYLIDSLIAGGAERSLASLAPSFVKAGVRLDVAYLYERDNVWLPAIKDSGARVISLAGAGGRAGALRRARSLLGDTRPDLVHTTLFDADVTGRIASIGTGVPVVCSLVNAMYGDEQLANPAITWWRLRGAQLLDAATARRVRRFHAVSRSVAATMSRRLYVARDRIDVIPRGRDAAGLGECTPDRRRAARAALEITDERPVLLAVGRHEYQKGFDVLLHSCAAISNDLPDVQLLIAGRDGSETARLRALTDQLGLAGTVSFLGFRSDVGDLLCAADVFVAPSRWEGSPGSVLEAMALETPIVATDIEPVREVLGEQLPATLVDVDDVDAIARAIVAVFREHTSDRTAIARARFIEHYTIEHVATEMLEFYERVL